MPNHIQNRLTFIGNKEDVEEIKSQISGVCDDGKAMQIDFNAIIRMPQELNIDSDSLLMPLENGYSMCKVFKDHIDEIRLRIQQNTLKTESVENFIQGIRNYIEHGHATWYGWAVDNWGTKWNAYSQNDERNTNNEIYFQTAWAAPLELIRKLSESHPGVKVQHEYADEDAGSNVGSIIFFKGLEVSKKFPPNRSNEAYELFLELHPDCDYIKKVNGKYTYIE